MMVSAAVMATSMVPAAMVVVSTTVVMVAPMLVIGIPVGVILIVGSAVVSSITPSRSA